MDYDTVHTMALLEAQREYMDMNDEDAEFDIDEEMAETETEAEAEVQCEPQATASTQAAKPQRKRRKTSLVWKDFVLVGKLHHSTKISHYNKVVNIPNSMTILGKLLEKHKGHNEILEMYKSHIEPGFKWSNFTVEEQAKVIVAPRSYNEMDGSKLSKEFPEMLPITEALIKYVFEPKKRT
ncbi:hypothetical protein HID58_057552 [Brassica napus]|uniref:Uncharacterized protein n=2 Tax=Brassica napus TaxID=3708 RepID=A0ABQ8ARM9_BRANA|nr:hypothetical protein HID58_057552 [Brassica napus]CDY25708.1 BnaC03g69670D [Brassica napus]